MDETNRCPRCACGVWMHFADGCHTACGFICRCPLTPWQIAGEESDRG